MKRSLSVSILSLTAGMILAGSVAHAEYGEKKHGKQWRKDHPRQNEVNNRLNTQTNRANTQAENGQITQGQANKIQGQDQRIYQQEQADKARNGGNYITAPQQAKLNREENRVNREDRRDVRQDASNNGGAAPAAGN